MSKTTPTIKILFLNQMAGPLFREMAEDLAGNYSPSMLYTGHPDTLLHHKGTDHLVIKRGPHYDKRNEFYRVYSWFKYFCYAFFQTMKTPASTLLFFVSNPPFLGLIGYILKKTRRQSYVVLVHDIHPDILINLNRLKANGIIVRIWRRMNRLIYENADLVFTIGNYMATNLEKQFDAGKTKAGKVLVVPPWVDTEFIKPIPKAENWFAKKYDLVDKLTILYSGNLGATHNIEFILDMARKLKTEKGIHFLIIGEGIKWSLVENAIKTENLNNITLLPFQPEKVLPYSMATGDVAIVSMQPGIEGLMVPSKAFYYLAAGCYLLFDGCERSELGDLCKNYKVGRIIQRDIDNNMLKTFTKQKYENFELLRQQLSRKVNSELFVQAIKSHFG